VEKCPPKLSVLNLGTDEFCEVDQSAGWICASLGLSPQIEHTGGRRGWVGDSPFIFLDTRRMRALGWAPKLSIRQGVERTVAWLDRNRWVLEKR
jgi:UDP-glucose 4-epimerase